MQYHLYCVNYGPFCTPRLRVANSTLFFFSTASPSNLSSFRLVPKAGLAVPGWRPGVCAPFTSLGTISMLESTGPSWKKHPKSMQVGERQTHFGRPLLLQKHAFPWWPCAKVMEKPPDSPQIIPKQRAKKVKTTPSSLKAIPEGFFTSPSQCNYVGIRQS